MANPLKVDYWILGKPYTFNPEEDQILKRGLLDPYTLSPNPDEWIVLDSYIFWSVRLQSPIIIPRWFITDLASIPRVFRWLISVNERHRLASLPHDFGYWLKGASGYLSEELRATRKDWDKVLKDFCIQQGVSAWKTWAIYTAVRLGGKGAYEDSSGHLYAPTKHREWYRDTYPDLGLDTTAGAFLIL